MGTQQRVFTQGGNLDNPIGLAFDGSGALYVASDYNDIVIVDSMGSPSVFPTGGSLNDPVALSPGYSFSGFFGPIDPLPTVNVARAGSAIPVKFSLDGNQGPGIFATGSSASQQITCDTAAPARVPVQ